MPNLSARGFPNSESTMAPANFMRRGAVLVVVLCGGDKRTQKQVAAEWKE